MLLLFWISITILCLTIIMTLEIAIGMRRMTFIEDVQPLVQAVVPKVSIIVPACNEQHTIIPALQSMIELDYPDFEIIVVNDRSTDNTQEVVEKFIKNNSNIKLQNITRLPKGWMGKSHALHVAAAQAEGEYLLFTDADIVMEKSTLSRAMQHVIVNKLDHMSIFVELVATGGLLNALFMDAVAGILMVKKPWKIKNGGRKHYMGIGAFNLVKATAYNAIQGHSGFSMHPIDDIMLGKVLKQQGYSQDCVFGYQFVKVKWYSSIDAYIDGLMKSLFAFYHFNVFKVVFGIVAMLVFNVVPLWAFFFTTGIVKLFFGLTVLIRILWYIQLCYKSKVSLYYSLWSLVSPYINIFILIKASIMTNVNQGITWRGTFYPLKELKLNKKV